MSKFRGVFVAGVSGVAFIATESLWYGDAPYYAADLLQFRLLEPGHLAWRPLGALAFYLAQQVGYTGDPLWVLQVLTLLGSICCVLAIYRLLSRFLGASTALIGAAFFAFSNGFWTYAYSGCPYSISVLFAILALDCSVPKAPGLRASPLAGLGTGLLAGLSVLFWGAQAVLIPAIWLWHLALTPDPDRSFVTRLRGTMLLGLGGLLTLGVPLLLSYHAAGMIGADIYKPPIPGDVGFVEWLGASSHGIRSSGGVNGVLRAAVGWAQSIVSVGDLGAALRAWRLGEAGFPFDQRLVLLGTFYGVVLAFVAALGWRWKGLRAGAHKPLIVAVLGLGLNISFGAYWQGTDLERYFPSLPLVTLGWCIGLEALAPGSRRWRLVIGVAVVSGMSIANVVGNIRQSLGAGSYRQQWQAALLQHASAGDVLFVLGNRKNTIQLPHHSNFPHVFNLSVATRVYQWEDLKQEMTEVALETIRRGGRVLVGESVLGLDDGPRDGWSFREFPTPSPVELDSFFEPWKGELLTTVAGERLWSYTGR